MDTYGKKRHPNGEFGVSPAREMLGGSNVLQSLENRQLWTKEQCDEFPMRMQSQLQSMLEARSAIITEDAARIVKIGISRPLRASAVSDFKTGDRVLLYMLGPRIKQHRWAPGFRVVGLTSHHVIAERGWRLIKYPNRKTRLNREPIVTTVVPQEQPFGPESDAIDFSTLINVQNQHAKDVDSGEISTLTAVAAEYQTGKWMPYYTC